MDEFNQSAAPFDHAPLVGKATIPEEFHLGRLASLRSVQPRIRPNAPLIPFGGDDPRAAEQYRIIRTKILHHPRRPRRIVVTSADSGDGKTVTVINLTGVLALNPESRILLLDADMHRAAVAEAFDVPVAPGLADVLAESELLANAVVRVEPFPNLFYLPAGKSRRAPADLLNGERWNLLAEALDAQFDCVVADSPPACALADFKLVENRFDGAVLVARQDHTNRALWARAIETVDPEKMIGVVMNHVRPSFLGRTLGHYYQYYPYSEYYERR